MTDGPGRSVFAAYVATVIGGGVVAIAAFYVLFTSGYPRFISRVLTDPVRAARSDPSTLGLLVASIGIVVIFISFIVIFGATYGPDPDDSRSTEATPEDVEERAERQ